MNRRSFLRGALSLGAITAIGPVPAMAALPRIVGDGVFDDTAGLQAFIDNKPFWVDSSSVVARDGILSGTFRTTSTLRFIGLRDYRFDASDATFCLDFAEDALAFFVSGAERCDIRIGQMHTPKMSTVRRIAELHDTAHLRLYTTRLP